MTRGARFNPFHPICNVTVIDSRPIKLHNSRIFGKFNFRHEKEILENLGNFRKKIDNFENLRQFEHSPNILATLHRDWKTLTKRFFFLFDFYRPKGLVRSHATAWASRALSTERNKSAVFHQSPVSTWCNHHIVV